MNTLHEVEKYAAQHGIVITPGEREKIAQQQLAERRRLAALEVEKPATYADRWNAFYSSTRPTSKRRGRPNAANMRSAPASWSYLRRKDNSHACCTQTRIGSC